MKLFLISAILIVAGFVSCRKQTPLELPSGAQEVSYTCLNGVLDSGEDGIDCGPFCTPCILSYADCELEDNVFSAGYTTTVTTAFSAGQVVSSTASGVLVITATSGNKFVKVTFGTATPIIFASYPLIQFGTPSINEAKLEYYNGTKLYTAYSDNAHLNKIGGKLSVEFCDVYMSTPTVGGYIAADGKITEN